MSLYDTGKQLHKQTNVWLIVFLTHTVVGRTHIMVSRYMVTVADVFIRNSNRIIP